ncbi:hypothetical protein ACOMHN_033518 [Nucella lapillus]
MLSVDTLSLPYQPHLRSPSPPASLKPSPPLQVQTAIDHRSRRQRPDRQRIPSTSSKPACTLAQDKTYILRPMLREDLPGVASLMQEEGWNIDFENMAIVYDMQPEAYFVAHNLRGRIVGHISGNRLNDSVSVLSYLIVSSEHKKQGLGSRLMKLGREAVGTPTALFYSMEDAINFHKGRSYETRRFMTLVRDFCLDPEDFATLQDSTEIEVVQAQQVDFDKINKYDSAVHGIARPEYLSRWLLNNDKVAYAAVDSSSGDVRGYISLSYYQGRWDVAPLYADSDDIALQLLKKASQEIAESVRVFVRIPADSNDGIKLFNTLRDTQHHRVLYLMADQPLPQDFTSDKIYSLSTACYGLK